MTAKKNQSSKIVRAAEKSARPPVVAVMGHIDHGKSTLLDYIRQANTVAGEAGGITQAVSAYEVEHKGKKITFLDTPGHEAFSTIRERGAAIADIAVLVVSAEDGPKPQTLEVLEAIKKAAIPFIVAINKIDKPNANVDRTKQQLAENEVLVEGYGGAIPAVELSGKTGENVPDLLEMIALVAEMEGKETDPEAPASGFILEANLNPKVGATATLIIKDGKLSLGDFIVVGSQVSKVKRLNNFRGEAEQILRASSPAQVTGWSELPEVGQPFRAYQDKKEAERAAAEFKIVQSKKSETKVETKNQAVEIPVVLKADVTGALEALLRETKKRATEAVGIRIVGASVGQINENDVRLAGGSRDSLLVGFNVKAEKPAQELAEKLGVAIQTFDIIYKMSEWLEEEVARRTPRVEVEESLGRAKLLKIFGADKNRQIVGGAVTQGRLVLGAAVKIFRREAEIARGKIVELQQQKIKVKEVPQDVQFGALVEAKIALAPGDQLEAFELVVK